MKTIIPFVCLLGAISFATQNAMAEGGVKFRAGSSNESYDLNVTPPVGSGPQYNFASTTYTGTKLGVTFMPSDSVYIDIASSSGTGTYNRPTYVGGLTRTDLAVILGLTTASINATDVIGNFYVGYKTGETKLAPPSGAPTGSSNLDFTASGLITGGGLIFPLGGAGALGLNLGLALMSGQYTQQNVGSAAATYRADYSFGYSYGIGYSLPITSNFGVALDYKANAYNYTFDAGLTTENSFEEKFTSTVASLYLKF